MTTILYNYMYSSIIQPYVVFVVISLLWCLVLRETYVINIKVKDV